MRTGTVSPTAVKRPSPLMIWPGVTGKVRGPARATLQFPTVGKLSRLWPNRS